MAYRNGTYIAFYAGGTTDPTASDIRYYRIMKAWHENDDIDFRFVNSHEKVAAVRDTSQKPTLRRSLLARLAESKNMVLIVGPTTRTDTDWVPFEIEQAVDTYGLPVIAVYPGQGRILNPLALRSLWPRELASRIDREAARVLHIPFKQVVIDRAVRTFDLNKKPQGGLTHYTAQAYDGMGIG